MNEIMKNDIDLNLAIDIKQTEDILSDLKYIIDTSQKKAYKAINVTWVQRNWLIGYRIAVEELKGANRAEYGAEIIKDVSKKLTKIYGKKIINLL